MDGKTKTRIKFLLKSIVKYFKFSVYGFNIFWRVPISNFNNADVKCIIKKKFFSFSPPPEYEYMEKRKSRRDTISPQEYKLSCKNTLHKHQSLERDVYPKARVSIFNC